MAPEGGVELLLGRTLFDVDAALVVDGGGISMGFQNIILCHHFPRANSSRSSRFRSKVALYFS